METGQVKAAGLKWRKLASGLSPVWVADEEDVKLGYEPKTVNLRYIANDPEMLVAKCNALQTEMLLWRTGYRRDPLKYDGTLRSLFDIYETHPRSPFHKIKPGTRRPYAHYLKRLRASLGSFRVNDISGIDILDWHDVWSENGRYIAAATMALSVLATALAFGVMLRADGCADALAVLRETRKKLARPRARTQAVKANKVSELRAKAHERKSPSSALGYALVFESTLRLWDVIGQWVPMDEPAMSDIIDADRNMKWFGLRWEDIDPALNLSYTPSKTEDTTGLSARYPLAKAPMFVEELAHHPVERRTGPVIVNEATGIPYRHAEWRRGFAKDRKAAGIEPGDLWSRDLRASGISEGRAHGATSDDAGKVAAHSNSRTTSEVYDRAVVEAADRFAEVRRKGREHSGNASGNGR